MNNAKDAKTKPSKRNANGDGVEKSYWRIIPRYSPEWINSIPRSLARGIWDLIQDSVDRRAGEGERGTAEAARRRKQIASSKLRVESRGTTETAGPDADGQDDSGTSCDTSPGCGVGAAEGE